MARAPGVELLVARSVALGGRPALAVGVTTVEHGSCLTDCSCSRSQVVQLDRSAAEAAQTATRTAAAVADLGLAGEEAAKVRARGGSYPHPSSRSQCQQLGWGGDSVVAVT